METNKFLCYEREKTGEYALNVVCPDSISSAVEHQYGR